LIGEDDGTGLHLVEIDADGVQDRLLDVGRPFSFSWSTDGRWMLWQTGSDHDEKLGGRMVLYDVEREQAQILDQPPGSFAAPAWSPVEGAWLAVSAEGEKNQLRSFEPDGATALVATANSDMAFSWSPTGNQVAYAMRERGIEGAYGPIHILDLDAGRTQQVTADAFRILGFFWAPDGQRLGYLIRMDLGHTFWAQWRTIDLVNGEDRGFAAFNPSPWMWFRIRSFTQHAQSHRFWSPDGRYLVYSDRDNALADRVWLVDTWADRGTKPIPVDGGVIGTWSWHP
jgi:Tol biopolymer transport system component